MQAELVRRLQLARVIVHTIPAAGENVAPRFSDVPAPPSGPVTAYFEDRLSWVMGEHGNAITPDPGLDSQTRDAIEAILDDPTALGAESRRIGQRLYDVQDRRNPAGIVVVGVGGIDQQPAVGILKLEHEKGVTAEERQVPEGVTFELVVHEDLMLTEQTILFKCAVFMRAAEGELIGIAADLQVSRVADFFLTRFLGCKLVQEPNVMTEQFLDVTERYIAAVQDPEKKNTYEVQLLAHLTNQRHSHVDPRGFASAAMSPREQDDYLRFLVENGASRTRFPKDIERIKGRLRRVAHEFVSGVRLVGPPDAMKERVHFAQLRNGQTRAVVEDELLRSRVSG